MLVLAMTFFVTVFQKLVNDKQNPSFSSGFGLWNAGLQPRLAFWSSRRGNNATAQQRVWAVMNWNFLVTVFIAVVICSLSLLIKAVAKMKEQQVQPVVAR